MSFTRRLLLATRGLRGRDFDLFYINETLEVQDEFETVNLFEATASGILEEVSLNIDFIEEIAVDVLVVGPIAEPVQ